MANFAPTVTVTLERFAGRMGLPLRPSFDGSVVFKFQRSGTLTFQPGEDGDRVVMILAAMPERPGEAVERHLIERAGHDAILNRFIHTGLGRDGSHHWAVALDNDELGEQLIEACLERLIDIRQSLI